MKILTTLLLLIAINTSQAQQKTNFSGAYQVNTTKTNFGDFPQNVVPKGFNVLQNGEKVTITRITSTGSFTESFAGGPVETFISGRSKRTASLKWNEEKSAFIVESDSGESGSKITEVWSLNDDGRVLTIDRHVEQANGLKYDIKAYYDKQP